MALELPGIYVKGGKELMVFDHTEAKHLFNLAEFEPSDNYKVCLCVNGTFSTQYPLTIEIFSIYLHC